MISFNQTTLTREKSLKQLRTKTRAVFVLDEDEEPTVTEPIYLSRNESENSSPDTTPDHHHEIIYPDSINQLKALN